MNSNLGLLRKKYINTNARKLTEAALFSLITTTVFFWIPATVPTCEPRIDITVDEDVTVQYDCKSDEYSPLASMLMNTEGDAIRTIITQY